MTEPQTQEQQKVAEWMEGLNARWYPNDSTDGGVWFIEATGDTLSPRVATFFYNAEQARVQRVLDRVGLIGIFTRPLDELAEFLTNMQASVCDYGTRDGDGRTCDCKFGYTPRSKFLPSKGGFEQNGCPELRQAARMIKALDQLRKEEL